MNKQIVDMEMENYTPPYTVKSVSNRFMQICGLERYSVFYETTQVTDSSLTRIEATQLRDIMNTAHSVGYYDGIAKIGSI